MDAVPSQIPSSPPHRLRKTYSLSALQHKDLSRSKSFDSSWSSHFEAVTAAELAFRLAQERTSSMENSKAPNNMSQSTRQEGAAGLARTHSIRFAGPSAVKTGGVSITCRTAPTIQEDVKPAHESPSVLGRHMLNEFKALTTPAEQSEYVEENIASQPSSYRKLRKAQSMYNPGEANSLNFTEHGLRIGGRPNRRSAQSSMSREGSSQQLERGLRRSFSFLRGATDRLSTEKDSHKVNDAAIQIARDQFREQIEGQRQKSSPTFLDSRKERRVPKPFRRTVRSNATNKYGNAVQSPSTQDLANKPKGFNERARGASQTLRRAIRKVFGRSPSKDNLLPAQQLSAENPHYGSSEDQEAMKFCYPPIPSPDVDLLRRVDSRETIRCGRIESPLDRHSARSLRSVASEDGLGYEGSRVTSWTASTAANTINGLQGGKPKRLSVIKEDGPSHQPSSPDYIANDRVNTYAAFCRPARFESTDPTAARRVFSALRREIQSNSPQHSTGNPTPRGEEASDSINERSLSGASLSADGNDRSVRVFGKSRDQLSSPFPRKFEGGTTQRMNQQDIAFQQSIKSCSSPDLTGVDYKMFAERTPQQIAEMNEAGPSSQKGSLREVNGGFSPSNVRIERKATSPYKFITHSFVTDSANASINGEALDNGQHLQRTGSASLSASIYSRTSGGHSLPDIGSSSSLTPYSKRDNQIGPLASVHYDLQEPANRSYSGTSGTRMSSNSSGQWKTHLASDTSYWEENQPFDDEVCVTPPIGRSGHKRENAQYDGDDVAFNALTPKITLPKQSLAAGIAKKCSRTSLRQAFAFSTPEKHQPSNDEGQVARVLVQQKENKPIGIQKQKVRQGFLHTKSNRQWKPDQSVESGLGSEEALSASPDGMRLVRGPERKMPQLVSPLSRKTFIPNAFVNDSMKIRRREMRISDESKDSSAFL